MRYILTVTIAETVTAEAQPLPAIQQALSQPSGPGNPAQTFRGHHYFLCHSTECIFYLSLLLLRNKKRLFVRINVSWTSMQMPPLGISYLLIISWSLVIQKLPVQLKKRQINLELHLSVSKRESKLNTTNTLYDRKASGFFCRTHILNFLSLNSFLTQFGVQPLKGQQPSAV